MNGLALARAYWERAGLPAFEARLPEALERAAPEAAPLEYAQRKKK